MEAKHIIELHFLRRELLDDIKQFAFVEADLMSDDGIHAKHQTFDIVEDGNIERVTRVLSLAFSECVEILYPYTKTPVEELEVRDDTLISDIDYKIEMHVPGTYSKTTCDLLEKYIHEFLVCSALADWFSITKPEASVNWKHKAEEAKDGIRGAKIRFTKKVRRGSSPFC